MKEHVNDPFVKAAVKEGYRSRAAYKLMQLDERDRLLRPGLTIVDLGAAPGGWSQVARERMGTHGRVIAIDLLPMEPIDGVTFLQADFSTDAGLALLLEATRGAPIDLVLSDMSPNISGIGIADQARHMALAELALAFAVDHLRPGGAFVVKLFQGEGFDEFLRQAKQALRGVVTRKPEASRDRSPEMYLVGRRAV